MFSIKLYKEKICWGQSKFVQIFSSISIPSITLLILSMFVRKKISQFLLEKLFF